MPEAVVLQTKFDGLRDQSFWKGRRAELRAEGSGGAALACCLKMVEQLKAVDKPSDAKRANDNWQSGISQKV